MNFAILARRANHLGATVLSRLTFTRPDDFHLHLRDGEQMRAVLPHTVAAVRPCDRHAESQARCDDRQSGNRLSGAYCRGDPARHAV